MHSTLTWLEEHMLPCMNKKLFGMDCPGCGMQRAIISLIKGDFYESFVMYPPLLFILGMIALLVIHLTFKLKHGASIIKWVFILNVGVITINFIVKIIHSN
jgi:hypothetical protein